MQTFATIAASCPPLLQAPIEPDQAEELATALKVLADPARLRLLSLIQAQPDGETCVCNLTEPLGLDEAEQAKAGRIGKNLEGRRELLRLVGLDRRLEERRARSRDRGKTLHASILTAIDHYGKIPR